MLLKQILLDAMEAFLSSAMKKKNQEIYLCMYEGRIPTPHIN